MSPRISIDNIVYRAFFNPEECRDNFGRFTIFTLLSDYWYIRLSEFGVVIGGTFLPDHRAVGIEGSITPTHTTITPTLFYAIRHVVGIGSKPQVGRINAGRVITRVTDMKTFWNGVIKKYMRSPMCAHLYAFHNKSSVSLVRFIALPIPASIGSNDISFFKSVYNRFFHTRHSMAKGQLYAEKEVK